jgi:hypothetical protein
LPQIPREDADGYLVAAPCHIQGQPHPCPTNTFIFRYTEAAFPDNICVCKDIVRAFFSPEIDLYTSQGNHTMKESLQVHRRRMAENGMRRVEVCVRQTDAELIRRVARTLAADDRASQRLRASIQASVPNRTSLSFKEWMATPSGPDDS